VPELAKVTAVRAMAQPFNLYPVPNVMAVPARMDPSTMLPAPRVAAVPRAQITFSALAPLIRTILVPAAVTKVVPAMKKNSAFGSPPASKKTLPEAMFMAVEA
jgi:hypothetical protein